MRPEEFQHALHSGLGRALRDVRSVPPEERRRILLDACLHHRSLDPQLTGCRGRWLARVLEASGDLEALAPAILSGREPIRDHWDLHQRIDLLFALAERRVPGAREALYQEFDRQLALPWHGADELDKAYERIVLLDGVDGLRYAARALGRRARADAEFVLDEWPLQTAQDELGASVVREALERESRVDEDVAEYLSRVRPWLESDVDEAPATSRPPDQTILAEKTRGFERHEWFHFRYADARDRLLSSPRHLRHYWIARWGAHAATDADLEATLAGLAVDEDPRLLIGGLRVFQLRAMPRLEVRVLQLLSHSDTEVTHFAHVALRHVSDGRVRHVALERLANGHVDGDTIGLLRSSYQATDAAAIRARLPASGEPGRTHDLASSLLDVFERHATRADADLLEWCYEWSACENCRGRAVKKLRELSALSESLRDECRYDSHPEVRGVGTRGPVTMEAPLPPEPASDES